MTAFRLIPLAVMALFLGCAPLMQDRVMDAAGTPPDTPTSGEMQKAVSSPAPPPSNMNADRNVRPTAALRSSYYASSPGRVQDNLAEEIVRELEALKENASRERDNKTDQSCPPPITFDLPVVLNEQVEKQIRFFQTEARGVFQRWMSNSTRYKDMMQDILADNDLPQDLIYVAMIESGFNLSAYSPGHAAGPWQFIADTGKRNGLIINQYVDERMDPVKSTRAAAQYLKKLHDEFGCWYLAMAAYNAGEGRVNRGIKQYNTNEFWQLSDYGYFKRETRDYVPRVLAAAIIAKQPEKYGFSGIEIQPPMEYEEVAVKGPLSLKDLAKAADCSPDALSLLNPELRLKIVPPHSDGYVVRVPIGSGDQVLAQSHRLPAPRTETNSDPAKQKMISDLAKHKVKRGDTLYGIARTYGTSAKTIMELNGLSRQSTLQVGAVLTVAAHKKSTPAVSTTAGKKERKAAVGKVTLSSESRRIVHRVRAGDTLTKLSRQYGVTLKDFHKWNEIGRHQSLKPGDELIVYVDRN